MSEFSLVEARDRLPDLIDLAVAGEEAVIARDGERLVSLLPVRPARRREAVNTSEDDPHGLAWLRVRRIERPAGGLDSGTLLSRMRDDEWR